MNAVLLALLVSAVYFAPAHIAGWGAWPISAVEYVAYGVESAALWAVLGWHYRRSIPAQAVCAWGLFEAIQRPICRLQFDMMHRVPLPDGQTLCEAAFGLPVGWLGFVVAGAVIARLTGAKNGC